MSKINQSALELVGHTPLLQANRYAKQAGAVKANIFAKLEYFNPAGSVKDRIALAMIEEAEKKGELQPGATIIEPTSGNTGIGLAAVAAAKGYKAILTLPDTMSVERRNLLKAYGARLELTEGSSGMKGAIAKAEELRQSIPGSVILGQFVNPANPTVHKATTGPEIWEQTDGKVDIFIAGVGTGGTITGVGEYLKEKNPEVKIVAVEPAGSPVLSKGIAGAHKIQGIGAGFVPDVLNTDIYDDIITIENEDAFAAGKQFAVSEGILVGISSGAALKAATILANRLESVYVSATLRAFVNRRPRLEIEGETVREILNNLQDEYPESRKALFAEDGTLRPFVNVYINDFKISQKAELETPVKEGDRILLLPAIAGGAPVESVISDARRKAIALDDSEIERFNKHLMLREIGVKGQKRIKAAKVLIAGLGALGAPAVQYLAAAGVGTIGLVDFDEVSLGNLQSQVIHGTRDVRRPKTASAGDTIKAINPKIKIEIIKEKLEADNIAEIIRDYDIIVDCTDNYKARYLLNDACVLLDKPVVFGAMYQFEGQVSFYNK